ncbi:hypothetical protein ACFLTP_08990 [Chloroflexota bacterium]
MRKPVMSATELRPIVEKAIIGLYGQAMKNIKIMKAERFPHFKEPKYSWMVHTEFNDDEFEYTVQMDVQIADARITRSVELLRASIKH